MVLRTQQQFTKKSNGTSFVKESDFEITLDGIRVH